MTIVAVTFVILIALLSLILLIRVVCAMACDDTEEQISREQAKTEAAIDADHQAARCAMNDAAGQSWRNISE